MVFTTIKCRYSYPCACGHPNPRFIHRKLYISSVRVNEERSPAEFEALQKALHERNTQRDDLLLKLRSLQDKNKQYKTKLEKDDQSIKHHHKILQKSYETQLNERETLLTNLQEIISEHETKILSLQQQVQGNISERENVGSHIENTTTQENSDRKDLSKSVSSGNISKLVNQIRELQQEKSELWTELTNIKVQIEICERDHIDTIDTLKQNLTKKESENSQLQEDVVKLKLLQGNDVNLESLKHSEKISATDNIQSDNKYRYRPSSIGFNSENEQIKTLQQENEQLIEKLTCVEKKLIKTEKILTDTESKGREEILNLSKENQRISRLLRDTKADVTSLQAREPEIMTKIERVEIEVESEKLRQKLSESQKENIALETDVQDWKIKYLETSNQLETLKKENMKYVQQLQDNVDEVLEMEEKYERQIEEMNKERDRKVEEVKNELNDEMKRLTNQNVAMRSKVFGIGDAFERLVEAHETLKKEAKHFPHILALTVQSVKQEAVKAIEDINEKNHELVNKYHKEMKLRKKYHNELVELRGNIRVFCRVRPCIKEDGCSSDIVITFDPYDDGLIFIANKNRSQVFELDKVFKENISQTEVFEEVKSLVTSCVDGYNVCIFAYGQTGSGKTYTMEGPVNDPGINQRALQELFNETKERGCDWEYIISVSVLEIYNENIRDLLNDDGNKLEIKMKSENGGLYVPGLTTIQVTSLNQVNQVFITGQKNRATATTNLNEHSSRSHALLCIEVTGVNKTTNTKTIGKLNLVDLAGSERVSRSGADGTRLKEAQNINKSLSCLGDVIHSLRSKQNHIPYRNSKLTYLLQDSLGGDSKTLMIVQASPVAQNVSETVCTLNFAQRVRMVQLGSANRQVETGDINENAVSTPTRSPLPRSPMYNSPKYSNTTPKHQAINNKTPAKRALTPRFKNK